MSKVPVQTMITLWLSSSLYHPYVLPLTAEQVSSQVEMINTHSLYAEYTTGYKEYTAIYLT